MSKTALTLQNQCKTSNGKPKKLGGIRHFVFIFSLLAIIVTKIPFTLWFYILFTLLYRSRILLSITHIKQTCQFSLLNLDFHLFVSDFVLQLVTLAQLIISNLTKPIPILVVRKTQVQQLYYSSTISSMAQVFFYRNLFSLKNFHSDVNQEKFQHRLCSVKATL